MSWHRATRKTISFSITPSHLSLLSASQRYFLSHRQIHVVYNVTGELLWKAGWFTCAFLHSLQQTLTGRRQIVFEKRLKAEKPQTSETGTPLPCSDTKTLEWQQRVRWRNNHYCETGGSQWIYCEAPGALCFGQKHKWVNLITSQRSELEL